jgi:hypothetical protein
MIFALNVADGVYQKVAWLEAWLTEGFAATGHRRGSAHYTGNAVDLRTRNLTLSNRRRVASEIAERLGEDYDVVLEDDPPHLHIEYDPK